MLVFLVCMLILINQDVTNPNKIKMGILKIQVPGMLQYTIAILTYIFEFPV